MKKEGAPNCLKCAYFKVTWDPALPRSCLVFDLRCRDLPSLVVYRAAGRHCPAFRMKEKDVRLSGGPGGPQP